ncbi:MAG: hypothetical protein IKB71_04745 [Lentisphaeria bacterium]|nr:hypothetical protein [Lentisphaeria bacterium]
MSRFCAKADFSCKLGDFNRKLHSSNTAPNLSNRGITDFTPNYKKMNFTYSRNHDWALWNAGQRVVDTHFVFPLMHLDANDPRNYYFDATDEMIRITQEAGSKIMYRLGTSIEHSGLRPDQKHFNSLPPTDYHQYAEALAGIIRHYTQGWANGFHYDIEYWEIWNEAENDPTCWKGSYEEFIKFFVIVLKRLKKEFPHLKIGGPAATGYREDLILPLLKACHEANIAPDFVSWHGYNNNVHDFVSKVQKMRDILDNEGLTKCETAITEWHYLLSWEGIQTNMSEKSSKNAFEGRTGLCGIDSAIYNLATLAAWQDTVLDLAFYYGASPKGAWGFQNNFGGYNKVFYSMCIFGDLLAKTNERIKAESFSETVFLTGGIAADGKSAMLMVADYRGTESELRIKIDGIEKAEVSAQLLDIENDRTETDVIFENGELILPKKDNGSSAFLIEFKF